MYTGLLHTHSIVRYALAALILVVFAKAILGMIKKQPFTSKEGKLLRVTTTLAHVQMILGLALYFVSPVVTSGLEDFGGSMKDASVRFWLVEHLGMMLVAVVLITIAGVSVKKLTSDAAKYKRIVVLYTIAIIFILLGIPMERWF